MFCPNCGTKNDDEAMFCEACGTPLREVETPEEQEFQGDTPAQDQQPVNEGAAWQPGPEQQPGTDGGTAWQEPPYSDPGYYGGQPSGGSVQKQKKPVPKLLIAVIAEAVIAVGLIVGLVKVTGDRFSPETTALNYWKAAMNHEWGKAYDYCSFPDSDLLSKQMYVNANANNTEIDDYESVRITEASEEEKEYMDNLSSLSDSGDSDQRSKKKNNDVKIYAIEYRLKGSEEKSYSYVTVTKSDDKRFLFWDDWKVTSSDSWASGVQMTIPENAEMSLNGVQVDSSDASVEDGMKTITIPYLFTGQYQMTVSEEGMEDYNSFLPVYSYGVDESYIELVPSQETVEQVAAQAGDDIKKVVESALEGKDFSEVEDCFTEEAISEGYVKEDYENLVENLKGDGKDSGVVTLQLNNMDVELDSQPSSSYIGLYVTIDKKETYRRSWGDRPGEDNYEITEYLSYEKDGTEWKLSYLPVSAYDF